MDPYWKRLFVRIQVRIQAVSCFGRHLRRVKPPRPVAFVGIITMTYHYIPEAPKRLILTMSAKDDSIMEATGMGPDLVIAFTYQKWLFVQTQARGIWQGTFCMWVSTVLKMNLVLVVKNRILKFLLSSFHSDIIWHFLIYISRHLS